MNIPAKKKKSNELQYELWIKIRCNCNKKKPVWTYMPLSALPDYFVCVVCRGRTNIKSILTTGKEVRQRGEKKKTP